MKGGLALPILLLILAGLCSGCLTARHGPPEETPVIQPPEVPTAAPLPSPPQPETPAMTPQPAPLPIRGDRPTLRLTFPFNSSGREHLVSLALDPAPLPSGGEGCPLMSWRPGEEKALASYYASIFRDPGEDALYDPLLAELQRIRRMERLNDDEYLELMVHFVQGIPYDPDAPVCPRTPARVILDGKGDCDEKSLLLLGLLSREGYDSAILLFPAKHHATAGIRIVTPSQPSFRVFDSGGRKYVYIETTRPSFIGLYPDDFATEEPVVIPSGNGTTTYRAINDVMHIVSTQKRMEAKMTWLSNTGEGTLSEIDFLKGKLTSGSSYDTQEEFDADYSRYNSLVTQYNGYADQFRSIRVVYQYIQDHQDDRIGVGGRIANSKVENLL
ncbi:MAG: hypothetical protein LUQ32_04005 [Methanomicrobiales archaeon]|nr:hypothetical protein [Methanomicrobiales archaeon]